VQPGDVVFVLEQRPHKQFKRVGNDLVLEKVRLAWRPVPFSLGQMHAPC